MTCVVGGLSGALFVGYSAQMYIYIYMLLDNTSVGYPGIEKFFGRWTAGDLIPTSPPRRGYLIGRLILNVACTLSRSKFALSDCI